MQIFLFMNVPEANYIQVHFPFLKCFKCRTIFISNMLDQLISKQLGTPVFIK